ncbi:MULTISPECIES: FtsX-like permease family protein [unclassified Granulicatella]|uniref:FtsX-like permease family protein n=1 Tax=unclassified Granulicatella TaxID=2630493 RepID=UPI0010743FE0|nr:MULTISPECIES: FtsX-like permease family protein [unclassified Granulicatella]MBF0780807.1 ABC transporter permease [Granulicatella sp. 19428wC4_WM01]TFU93823.1 ABC transporter permease [Granulicatella sp. WM01]
MTQIYGYRVRVQEKLKHPQIIILELFSIAIALYFVMMFLSKVDETNRHLAYFNQQLTNEYVVVSVPEQKSVSTPHTWVKEAEDYLLVDKVSHLVSILVVDKQYNQFYDLTSLKNDEWQLFISQPNQMILSLDLARELNKKVGDTVEFNQKTYMILGITSNPWHKHKAIVLNKGVFLQVPQWKQTCTLTLFSKDRNQLDDSIAQIPYETLSDIFKNEIISLQHFLIFLMAFSLLFIVIASLNIFLIFKTNLQKEKPSRQIKWLFGETKLQFMKRICLEYVITTIIAFHISVVVYFILLPFVPNFFYFQLTYSIYLNELLFVIMVSLLCSICLSLKQVCISYNDMWR